MRILTASLLAALLALSAPADAASDSRAEPSDPSAQCRIEDWRWYMDVGEMLMIQGTSNCESGWMVFRVYEGAGEEKKFLGIAKGSLEGYAFDALIDRAGNPKSILIRYTIDPED